MNKFDIVVRDLLTAFNKVKTNDKDREKNYIKLELFLNLRKLTESYDSYAGNIAYLSRKSIEDKGVHVKEDEKKNDRFNRVIEEYYTIIDSINYDDSELNFIKTELLLNFGKLTQSYEHYRKTINMLSKREEDKKNIKVTRKYALQKNN